MKGQYLYQPDPPPAGPGGTLRRLLTSALLVAGIAFLVFVIAPYVVKDAPPPQAFPTPTVPPPPSTPTDAATNTPTITYTVTPMGTPADTATPYAGFTAISLDQLNLKLDSLRSWTNADWTLFFSSKQLNSFIVDPDLMASVRALNPLDTKMQVFVQAGGLCTQPYCQVSWVGIVFPNPDAAYRALTLFTVIHDPSAPELKLANSYDVSSSTTSGASTPGPAEKGIALSFCYLWKNMFIRISTLSQFYPSSEDLDQSINLVHEIFASWGRPTTP